MGHRAACDEEPALEVAFEAVAGEVGAAYKRGAPVDDLHLGVHGGAWGSLVGGPLQALGEQIGEGLAMVRELGVVGVALEDGGDHNAASGGGGEG